MITVSVVSRLYACDTDGLVISHLPHGPTAYYTLFNTVMRHDIPDVGTMSEQYPHLIFHNFTTDRGERVSNCCIVHVQLIIKCVKWQLRSLFCLHSDGQCIIILCR